MSNTYVNHHSQFQLYGDKYCAELGVEGIPLKKTITRKLQDDDPELTYRRRKDELKTVHHWGQRKLLMSEIEFLTMYAEEGDLVVYAGAAPGTHIKILAFMFPFLKFVLVDPNPFKVKETDRIECRQEYFTDEMAQEFAGKDVLFISDIRTDIDQDGVDRDMLVQQKWVEIMKPKNSILKFRLPWCQDCDNVIEELEYLDGEVYFPVWGPRTTTEGRLVINNSLRKKKWDCAKYERQMFYFNVVTRTQWYPNRIKAPGLDHCYDCCAEVIILKQYLQKHGQIYGKGAGSGNGDINRLSKKISQILTKGRQTLKDRYEYYINTTCDRDLLKKENENLDLRIGNPDKVQMQFNSKKGLNGSF